MRLGQLARQLEIKPEKIVSYLEKEKQLTIKEHPNSKVEDELIDVITTHFKPVVAEEVETTEEVKKEPVAEEIVPEEVVEKKEPELIKAVQLEPAQELKIVGKIDLPDKKQIQVEVDGVVYDQETLDNKKKEELVADRERREIAKEEKRKEEEERRRLALEKRKIEEERQTMLATEKHNTLTLEEEKKKAAILKVQQEKEERLEEIRKQKQKEHYAQKHAATTTAPSNKKNKKKTLTPQAQVQSTQKVETPVEEKIEVQKEEAVQLNAYQKFIKWLNT